MIGFILIFTTILFSFLLLNDLHIFSNFEIVSYRMVYVKRMIGKRKLYKYQKNIMLANGSKVRYDGFFTQDGEQLNVWLSNKIINKIKELKNNNKDNKVYEKKIFI